MHLQKCDSDYESHPAKWSQKNIPEYDNIVSTRLHPPDGYKTLSNHVLVCVWFHLPQAVCTAWFVHHGSSISNWQHQWKMQANQPRHNCTVRVRTNPEVWHNLEHCFLIVYLHISWSWLFRFCTSTSIIHTPDQHRRTIKRLLSVYKWIMETNGQDRTARQADRQTDRLGGWDVQMDR